MWCHLHNRKYIIHRNATNEGLIQGNRLDV